MRTLIALACLAPITTHAIQVIYPQNIQKLSSPPIRENSSRHQIEAWQWAIYEKHNIPIAHRYILETIRLKECPNTPWGYCYRSSRMTMETACKNTEKATWDAWIFQMNHLHGKIFDITMTDLCNMRKAIQNKSDEDFIFWRDKLFEDQMLWTHKRSIDILENPRLSWTQRMYKVAWRHHSNKIHSVNVKYSNDAVRIWQKIAPMEIYK